MNGKDTSAFRIPHAPRRLLGRTEPFKVAFRTERQPDIRNAWVHI